MWFPPSYEPVEEAIPTLTDGVEYVSPDGAHRLRIKAVDSMGIITVHPAVNGSIYVPMTHFAGWKRAQEDWGPQKEWAAANGWTWRGP
jgi:hypothetical protein